MGLPVAVVGAGPLGAATALALTRRAVGEVVLVDGGDERATWRNSGGSICWYRPDPVKADLIRRTADAILARVEAGAPIRVRRTPYLILARGVLVPALNVASGDVVADLVRQAEAGGVARVDVGRVHAVVRRGAGWTVRGERGAVDAGVVLLALGAGNPDLLPGLPRRLEKRQLFVLDLPVDADRADLPHTVVHVGGGSAYAFVKQFDEGLRVVVGQEGLVADDDATGPVDHWAELLAAGLADALPFLAPARPERILWGRDWADKLPHVATAPGEPTLLAVNCGSAVRVCVAAGELAADAVMRAARGVPAAR
ncbi:MAG TPA: FAD-dependent oxidoreductase [Pseudonocardia sp.]|jgi:glycine/D-amino acid oxidase-like deaminating enzyme